MIPAGTGAVMNRGPFAYQMASHQNLGTFKQFNSKEEVKQPAGLQRRQRNQVDGFGDDDGEELYDQSAFRQRYEGIRG